MCIFLILSYKGIFNLEVLNWRKKSKNRQLRYDVLYKYSSSYLKILTYSWYTEIFVVSIKDTRRHGLFS